MEEKGSDDPNNFITLMAIHRNPNPNTLQAKDRKLEILRLREELKQLEGPLSFRIPNPSASDLLLWLIYASQMEGRLRIYLRSLLASADSSMIPGV